MKITNLSYIKNQLGFFELHADFLPKPCPAIAVIGKHCTCFIVECRIFSRLYQVGESCGKSNSRFNVAHINQETIQELLLDNKLVIIRKSKRSKTHKAMLERLNKRLTTQPLQRFTCHDVIIRKALQPKKFYME